jgi:hypothetical protein
MSPQAGRERCDDVMKTTNGRRRWTALAAGLMVAAVACLGSGDAEAQYRRRYVARDLRMDAEMAAKVELLNRLVAEEQRRRAAAAARQGGRRGLRPGEIPVWISPNIPMYGPVAPGQQYMRDALTGRTIGAARANCYARRESQPYDRFGRLQNGWHDSMIGPQLNSCP